MKILSLQVCQNKNGRLPFADWFQQLDRAARVKISAALFQMEEGNFADSKYLSMGIWERRVHAGPGYRIYFAKERDRLIILLGGGTKGTQPLEIRRAQTLWAYYRTARNDE